MKTCLPLTLLLLAGLFSRAQDKAEARPDDRPRIQVALLLDTSNSMDGLIDQAKTRLWNLVNQFVNAKRDGKAPRLEVALYEYGNDGLPAAGGHIRKVLDLTEDLDKISEALFALRTNGGSEYCAWVIGDSLDQLAWSKDVRDIRAIFIAGNEPFNQGTKPYPEACKKAKDMGIPVNTIFCGGYREGEDTKWRDGAVLAGGSYSNIDHERAVAHVPAPQDTRIAELSVKLNSTYIAYGGRRGEEAQARQAAQDTNAAAAAPSVAVARAASKASGYYQNAQWDLVDALAAGKDLAEMKEEELPEAMKKLAPAEREAFVKQKQEERKAIQKEIRDLNTAREEFVKEELKKRAEAGGEKVLDDALLEALKDQAVDKGFSL